MRPPAGSGVLRSSADHQKAGDVIAQLRGSLKALRSDEAFGWGDAIRTLVQGRGAATQKLPSGASVKLPGYTKADRTWVRAAADLEHFGALSPESIRRLHRLGYTAKMLGVKSAPARGSAPYVPGA